MIAQLLPEDLKHFKSIPQGQNEEELEVIYDTPVKHQLLLRPSFTSPSPDSEISQQSPNASVEYNQSDEEHKATIIDLNYKDGPWKGDLYEHSVSNRKGLPLKGSIQMVDLTTPWEAPDKEAGKESPDRVTRLPSFSHLTSSLPQPFLQQIQQFQVPQTLPAYQPFLPFLLPTMTALPSPTTGAFPFLYATTSQMINADIISNSYSAVTMNNIMNIQSKEDEFDFAEVHGKYKVIEKIGEGTFSSVYKAVSLMNNSNHGKVFALKRISATCRPSRILNEIQHLKNLGGTAHVSPLLGGLRFRDQVTLVLPYFEHDKFKDYITTLSLTQMQNYMKALLQALNHLHANFVIHRDIKPGNFLYHVKSNSFMLVDFGLAQMQSDSPPSPTPEVRSRKRSPASEREFFTSSKRLRSSSSSLGASTTGLFSSSSNQLDYQVALQNAIYSGKRPMQAPRAGTRGFRAPEVLLKCPNQTTAIDIWSAGIIFLCMLTMRYPFFNSPDDLSALSEIAALFGTKEVHEVALSLGRRVHFPRQMPAMVLKDVCSQLSGPRNYVIPDSAYDLLARTLELDPAKRITSSQALQHPFFSELPP